MLLALLAGGALPTEAHAQERAAWLRWSEAEALPGAPLLEGAFVGVAEGALLVAGGVDAESGVVQDAVYALRREAGGAPRWARVGRLPYPLARGAAVPTPEGLLLLGGTDGARARRGVVRLRWDAAREAVAADTSLPPLPEPLVRPAAAVLGTSVYVAGGQARSGAARSFWRLDLSPGRDLAPEDESVPAWEPLAPWPGPARSGAALVAQSGPEHEQLYLLGGRAGERVFADGYTYDPRRKNNPWRRLADLPRPMAPVAALPFEQTHLLLAGRSAAAGGALLAYHTLTDTWIAAGALPAEAQPEAAAWWDGGLALLGSAREGASPELWTGTSAVQKAQRHFYVIDYVALVLYLTVLVGVGVYFSRRGEASTDDFFLGGRRIPYWAAGISIMATQVSSIGFMALPAKVFATDWAYFAGVFTWFVVVPVVVWAYIPFFRRLNVTSAYEYLEARFNVAARLFAAALYCLLQIVGRLGVVLYLPALALSAVTGLNVYFAIVVMGLLATLYTVLGGMEAVIWTDVVQAVVLIGGAILCVGMVVFGIEGGAGAFIDIALADGKFDMAPLEWDATAAVLWVVVVGNVFNRLGVLTSDQSTVQRYLTTRDEVEAKRSLWAHVAASVPWAIVIYLLGTALYVFYKTHPELLSPAVNTDGLVPLFIAQQLPPGVSGLVIAALFAAAMSSLDSAMHSTATVLTTDVYRRFFRGATDASALRLARILTGGLGLFGTGIALVMVTQDVLSMADFFIGITGLFAGSAAGLFALGIFTRRAHGTGAMVGALGSGVVLYAAQQFTPVHFFLYGAVGFGSCFALGYLASLVLPGADRSAGLTVYALRDDARRGERASSDGAATALPTPAPAPSA